MSIRKSVCLSKPLNLFGVKFGTTTNIRETGKGHNSSVSLLRYHNNQYLSKSKSIRRRRSWVKSRSKASNIIRNVNSYPWLESAPIPITREVFVYHWIHYFWWLFFLLFLQYINYYVKLMIVIKVSTLKSFDYKKYLAPH